MSATSADRAIPESTALRVSTAQAVFLVNVLRGTVLAVLDAHKDVVRCMCVLPTGLATGGGKQDATVRIWETSQWQNATTEASAAILSEASALKELGYVFALTVLLDAKPGSQLFALAAARYNA